MILEQIPRALTRQAQAALLEHATALWGSPFLAGFQDRIRAESVWDERPGLLAELFRAYILFHQAEMEGMGSSRGRVLEPAPGEAPFEPCIDPEYAIFFDHAVQAARGDSGPALDLARLCAEKGDITLRRAAVAVYAQYQGPRKFDLVSAYMEVNGVDSLPFPIGVQFRDLLASQPALVSRAREMLRLGPAKLRQGILHSLTLGVPMAGEFRAEILDLMDGDDPETKGMAVIAIGYAGMRDEAVVEGLWRCAGSADWFVRGNAIRSASRLGIDPLRFAGRALELLGDDEGHDWTVAESAASALKDFLRVDPAMRKELQSRAGRLSTRIRERLATLLEKA